MAISIENIGIYIYIYIFVCKNIYGYSTLKSNCSMFYRSPGITSVIA